jgi:RHS repeat-associated protein
MLRLSWLIGIIRLKVGCDTRPRRVAWLLGLGIAAVLLTPAGALGATCTDTWTGPVEGNWEAGENWSLGTVPTSTEVACIGPKTSVKVLGNIAVGVLQVEGTLMIGGGLLEVTNSSEASSIASLSIRSVGTLTGAGTVDVYRSLSVQDGVMAGSGTTVIQSAASATIAEENGFLDLEGRMLVNEGLTEVEEGDISVGSGTEIVNSGTFKANSEGGAAVRGPGTLVNTGLLEKTSGSKYTEIQASLENLGTVKATSGSFRLSAATGIWSSGSVLEGDFEVVGLGTTVTGGSFFGQNATVELINSTLDLTKNNIAAIGNLALNRGTLTGAGTAEVSKSFTAGLGNLEGSGATIILHGATGSISPSAILEITEHQQLINEGVITDEGGGLIYLANESEIINFNTFKANAEIKLEAAIRTRTGNPSIQNYGLFEKTEGNEKTLVDPHFESLGAVVAYTGELQFSHPVRQLTPTQFAERSPFAPHRPHPKCGDPVNCATGNFYETQTDLAVGGRGVGLDLTRTYNSQAAAEGVTGIFGHGWSSSFTDHVIAEKEAATVDSGSGGTVTFAQRKGGEFVAPNWTQAKLTGSSTVGYSLILENQVKYQFEGSTGRLQSLTDRNGNRTTLAYNKAGQLETITDPAGRKITLAYNGEGLVESAKDPMGHTAKYEYEEGTLKSVTLPGETKARWQYHYGEAHQMTTMIDGRGGETSNEYNAFHQLTAQNDPAGHKLKFEYEAFHTVITNNTTGSVTSEWFNSFDEPTSITHGFGTESANTDTLSYDTSGNLLSRTDGDNHTATWTYNSEGDMTSETNPDNDQTKWTYDGTHDILTSTNPTGEKTTVTRNAQGGAEIVERPAPGGSMQTTTYHYNANGEVTSAVDPLKHTWTYEYDSEGDRTAAIDPEGDKYTFGYNEDSYETSHVTPDGNIKGGEVAQYTTKIERDAQNRATLVTDPLGHTIKYTYDGDGNLETLTDGEGHKTTNVYNADDQPTEVKEPNGTVTEAEYDGEGHVVAQIDGNKHKTTYMRNVLGEVIEVKDPLGRVKKLEYDAAGNLIGVLAAAGRKTTYAYDPDDRLKEVSCSDGKTATIKYEYNADGNRTKMTDASGTTSYVYDILGRLTQDTDGNGDIVAYEYDIAGNQTKLTYPGGNMLTRAYDSMGRLQSVTDWLKNTTTFGYDPNSNLTTTTFPKGTSEQDKVAYNHDDQVVKVTMTGNGLKVLASVAYTRGNDGQVKTMTTTGLPGSESVADTYDANSRLLKSGSTAYEYDNADDPTRLGSNSSVYDAADELKTSGGTVYGYDQLGERSSAVKAALTTVYGYDQAGNLIQVKQGSTGLNDLYTYNGNGLRTAQIEGKTTSHLTWDVRAGEPVMLSDEQYSYIYGPTDLPIEAVPNKGGALFYHHDQQGSTRLLTGTSGAIEGSSTYDAYGNLTGSTGKVTTPLGYDGQYTNTDTGLIYLRARSYDPATAQFLSADPIATITQTPYAYGLDNPLDFYDPSGLIFGIPGTPSTGEVASAVTGAIGSHAGAILEGVGVGASCLAGPEVCVPIALGVADATVDSADVHATLNPSEAADLPSTVLQDLAAAGVSALPGTDLGRGAYEAFFGSQAGEEVQLTALGTVTGIGVSYIDLNHQGDEGEGPAGGIPIPGEPVPGEASGSENPQGSYGGPYEC